MSFVCYFCKKHTSDGVPNKRILLEYQEKVYQNRKVSYGWEIVKEVNCCPDCAQFHTSNLPPKREKLFKEYNWFREIAREERRKVFDKAQRTNNQRYRKVLLSD